MEEDFLYSPLDWGSKSHGNRAFFFDAFISHAGGDRSIEFVENLRSHGVKVWHDGSQEMGDARWRMRLVNALLRSRFVILVVDNERNLLEHDWVIAEWESALEAERLSGVSRLIVAKWNGEARVPPSLSKHPQYIVGEQSANIARLVVVGNILPNLLAPPGKDLPSVSSMVRDSLSAPEFPTSDQNATRLVVELTMDALSEVQADPRRPAHALYKIWLLSHDAEALNELDLVSLSPVIEGLEVLSTVGHAEGRANSCFMLRELAARGCEAAGEALLRIVRREEDGDILRLLLGWFFTSRNALPSLVGEDYTHILLILPTYACELVDKAISLAAPEADLAKLRHFVFRVTYRHFQELRPKIKYVEAEARFKFLRESAASSSEWEIFFRGLAMDAQLEIPLINLEASLPAAGVEAFLEFVERFADEGSRHPSTTGWCMQYEKAVLEPVAIACTFKRFGDKPNRTYRDLLKSLEAPVREDLKMLKELRNIRPKAHDLKYVSLLFKEMKFRATVVKLYRRGPHFEQSQDGCIYIKLLTVKDLSDLMAARSDLVDNRIFLTPSGRPKHRDITSIWERWRGVPLV